MVSIAVHAVPHCRRGDDARLRHTLAGAGRQRDWLDQMVDLLRTTGDVVRGLALPAFMDNALRQADAIHLGKMVGPIAPDKKLAHTATRDTGATAAAAALLIDRSWSGREDVLVLGPEERSYAELAAIVS